MFRNSWREVRDLPRTLWILAASVLINRVGSMVVPLLTLYVTQGLSMPASTAGWVLSAYGVGALLTSPIAGRLSDVVGPARMMRWSLLASGTIMCLFPLFTHVHALVAASFVLAAITEAYRPASMSIISQLVAPAQRRAAYALNRLAVNLGMSVGPALGTVIATYSFTAVFLVDGLSTLLAGLGLALFFHPVLRAHLHDESTGDDGESGATATRAQFAVYLGASVLLAMIFFQLEGALPLFVVGELHQPATLFGMMFTLNTVIIVAVEVPLNAMTAHWTHRRSMGVGAVLVALGFGGTLFVSGVWGLVVTTVLWTFGEMMLFPAMSAWVAAVSPPARRGVWMGMQSMAFNAGFATGPALGTLVMERYGSSVLWAGVLVVGLATALVYSRVYEPRRA